MAKLKEKQIWGKCWPKLLLIFEFEGPLSIFEAKNVDKILKFGENRFKNKVSIFLEGFSKIIEILLKKEVIYSSTIKIDESASKLINRYKFSNKKMCFCEFNVKFLIKSEKY